MTAGRHVGSKIKYLRVPGRLLPLLDLSCGDGAPAPAVAHATVRYQRRKRRNKRRTKHGYLVALYECTDGYLLQPGSTGALYCSQGQWLGDVPQCESLYTTTTTTVTTPMSTTTGMYIHIRYVHDVETRVV